MHALRFMRGSVPEKGHEYQRQESNHRLSGMYFVLLLSGGVSGKGDYRQKEFIGKSNRIVAVNLGGQNAFKEYIPDYLFLLLPM